MRLFFLFAARLIELRIEGVKILLVKTVCQQSQAFAETLIMHDLAFSEEADDVLHIIIIAEAQDIVISGTRLLFRCKILMQIRDRVALALDIRRRKRSAGGRLFSLLQTPLFLPSDNEQLTSS